jgi:hypothetical protein
VVFSRWNRPNSSRCLFLPAAGIVGIRQTGHHHSLLFSSSPPLYRKFPDQQQQPFNIPIVFTRKPFVTHRRSFSFAPQMALVTATFNYPKKLKK